MKFFATLLCCCILAVNKCQGETWTCSYYTSYSSSYECTLWHDYQNPVDITNIDGQHEAEKSDDDVKLLRIYYRNLKSFSSIFCHKFENLEVISMNNTEIGPFDENSLQNCKNLKKIELDGRKIRELPEKLLAENFKLTIVSIFRNELKTLAENFFQNQHQLERLNLAENHIHFLASNFFDSLVNLQFLSLWKNELQSLDPKWFMNLKSLEQLFLDENGISDLPRGIFAPLKNLKVLTLERNKLTVIHVDSGFHSALFRIDVQYNKITALDEKIIDKTALKELSMNNNLCYRLNIYSRNDMREKLKNCFKNYRPRCGKSKSTPEEIISGSQVTQGSFPWIVAVEKTNGEFLCTGTLVASRKIVTTASCIQGKNVRTPIQAKDIKVIAGAHDLNEQNEAGMRTAVKVHSILVHPKWNAQSERYDGDISILVLEQDMNVIEPVCLIKPDSTSNLISNGIVVGFQKSKDQENIATTIDTSIHKNRACVQINPDIGKVSSIRTFCGASGNETCSIGIGSGLFVQHEGVFYLRGIASSLVGSDTDHCAADSVTIFNNMLMYGEWMKEIVS